MHPAATAAFWNERWQLGQIGFHEGKPNAHLLRHWASLGLPTGSTVFVPLCGKTVDMAWLAAQGHRVVGAELSALACAAFFDEQGLTPKQVQDGPFVRWTSGPFTLLQGDVFDVRGTFDALWDRAATIALPPDVRPRYAAHLHTLLAPAARGLMVTLQYDPTRRDGPPFCVPPDETLTHHPGIQLVEIEQLDDPRFADAGGASNRVWRLG